MGFFTGPSDIWLEKVATGICQNYFQIKILLEFSGIEKDELKKELIARGFSTSENELIQDVVSIIKEHNMGTWKKGKFLMKLNKGLVSEGITPDRAHKFVTAINVISN